MLALTTPGRTLTCAPVASVESAAGHSSLAVGGPGAGCGTGGAVKSSPDSMDEMSSVVATGWLVAANELCFPNVESAAAVENGSVPPNDDDANPSLLLWLGELKKSASGFL